MFEILDLAEEAYSSIMIVVNFICFGALCLCITFIFVVWTIGQYDGAYKHVAHGAFLLVIGLLVIHYITSTYFGIPLVVPPMGTPYFAEFMHIIQYVVTIAFVFLLIALFILGIVSRLDHFYSHPFMSACIAFVILVGLHFYVADQFGVMLIFPPTLW